MTQFLQTICRTCGSCENLLTLDPGPEQCEQCAVEEQKEQQLEQREESTKILLKRSMKYETESDSSNSDRPLKYTIKKVKNEYTFDNDNEFTIGVSDIESTGDQEQEENVSSTTAAAITTTTTTTTGSTSLSFSSAARQSPGVSRMPTGPPQEWSVEDVIKFIADTDPALAVHAELFRKHVRIRTFLSVLDIFIKFFA